MVLRTVFQNLLRQAARDALGRRATPLIDPENSPELASDIGFVFAMGIEAGGFEDMLSDTRDFRGDGFRAVTGSYRGRRISMVITGMGSKAARRGTEILIAGHRPCWIISTGFSGGLSPEAKLGDIVLANRIVNCEGTPIPISLPIDPESARQTGLHVGTLVAADDLVCLPAQKAALGVKHAAVAVDLESWAVARVCQDHRMPFLAVRIISDGVNTELPEFLSHYSRQKSLAGKTGVVVGALLKQPRNFKTMYGMREESLQLSDRLARFLASLVRELVPEPASSEPATR